MSKTRTIRVHLKHGLNNSLCGHGSSKFATLTTDPAQVTCPACLKLMTRKNPARWAHGTMSYRHAPDVERIMRNPWPHGLTRKKARLILHHKKVRGHPLTEAQRRFFGARASGYPMRRNPYRRNPGGGGIGMGTIALLGVGAFLLMGGGRAFASVLPGTTAAGVPPGYTPIGNGLYRAPNGTIVARNPQTGQMVAAAPGTTPTSAEDLLTRAGISLIPSVANTLASWVSGLFTTQHTATTPVTESPALPSGGAGVGTSDVLRSDGYAALPPLPPLPTIFGAGSVSASTGTVPEGEAIFGGGESLPPLEPIPWYPISSSPDGQLYDLGADTQLGSIDWSQYELPPLPAYDESLAWGGYELPALPDVGLTVGGGDVTLYSPEAVDYWGGYMGLGRRFMPGFRQEQEARFLRRPPSYR